MQVKNLHQAHVSCGEINMLELQSVITEKVVENVNISLLTVEIVNIHAVTHTVD